jgi:hypothetical protein
MNLENTYLWGTDIAIKKLRPGANFQIEGPHFTIWNCPNNSNPPSWEEIHAQIEKDQSAAEKWLEQNKE